MWEIKSDLIIMKLIENFTFKNLMLLLYSVQEVRRELTEWKDIITERNPLREKAFN